MVAKAISFLKSVWFHILNEASTAPKIEIAENKILEYQLSKTILNV
jgi:hypothetical protein